MTYEMGTGPLTRQKFRENVNSVEDIFDQVEAEARIDARQSEEIAEEVIAPRSEANPRAGTPPPGSELDDTATPGPAQ